MARLLQITASSSPFCTSTTSTSSNRDSHTTLPHACLITLPRPKLGRSFPFSRGLRIALPGRTRHAASLQKRAHHRRALVVCEAQETITAAGDVTDATFSKLVLECDIPVLVDFWAPWCGPCRMIAPLIDELARQYAGKLRCLKINTDDSPKIATEYGIRSIPTVMIFKNGEKMDTIIGAVPKTTLTLTIEKYLL